MRVLILICIVAAAYASRECGENAHYAECGTACPLTCDNYQNPPRMCIMMCKSGCQCDKGFVKASDGSCVRPEQCPTKSEEVCGENAHWESCGTACPLTCDNYENPPKICVLSCNIGCHCDQGYVKTSDGRCVKPEQCRSKTTLPAEKSCTDKADPGMCLAYIPSWFYNSATGKCEQFIYGGCQGNGNRYSSEEECQQHCQGQQKTGVDDCDLPPEVGVCKGAFHRYYFDRITGQCEIFTYGGCGGNENNFETREECQRTCSASQSSPLSLCLEEKVTGPCRGYFKRFYYNQESGKCEQFVYGGCGGSSNNFESEELCDSVCVA